MNLFSVPIGAAIFILCFASGPGVAQDQPPLPTAAPTAAAQAPEPLSDDEMEVLVARIALYPDELVALISGAALLLPDRRRGALSRGL